ncbi:MAG: hypothetical protein JSS22_15330, partial [Proteobacteria bacterium]|nr:hypothetical protein [Pseudomonadota bacterium]
MDMHSNPEMDIRDPDDHDPDYWGVLLDAIPPVLRAWKLIALVTVLAGAITYFVSPPKTFSSISYVGKFDDATAKYFESIVLSEPILNQVLDKFPNYPKPAMPETSRRRYLRNHIKFALAGRANPKESSLYELE